MLTKRYGILLLIGCIVIALVATYATFHLSATSSSSMLSIGPEKHLVAGTDGRKFAVSIMRVPDDAQGAAVKKELLRSQPLGDPFLIQITNVGSDSEVLSFTIFAAIDEQGRPQPVLNIYRPDERTGRFCPAAATLAEDGSHVVLSIADNFPAIERSPGKQFKFAFMAANLNENQGIRVIVGRE